MFIRFNNACWARAIRGERDCASLKLPAAETADRSSVLNPTITLTRSSDRTLALMSSKALSRWAATRGSPPMSSPVPGSSSGTVRLLTLTVASPQLGSRFGVSDPGAPGRNPGGQRKAIAGDDNGPGVLVVVFIAFCNLVSGIGDDAKSVGADAQSSDRKVLAKTKDLRVQGRGNVEAFPQSAVHEIDRSGTVGSPGSCRC